MPFCTSCISIYLTKFKFQTRDVYISNDLTLFYFEAKHIYIIYLSKEKGCIRFNQDLQQLELNHRSLSSGTVRFSLGSLLIGYML